jgi:hypothetical protein
MHAGGRRSHDACDALVRTAAVLGPVVPAAVVGLVSLSLGCGVATLESTTPDAAGTDTAPGADALDVAQGAPDQLADAGESAAIPTADAAIEPDSVVDASGEPADTSSCESSCGPERTCVAGACTCPPSKPMDCGAHCEAEGPANCGGCGKACEPGFACAKGQCVCPPPSLVCSGTCVPPGTANCGACGKSCAPGEACAEGACSIWLAQASAFDLAVAADLIYWTDPFLNETCDPQGPIPQGGLVYRMPKSGGAPVVVEGFSECAPTWLTVDADAAYWFRVSRCPFTSLQGSIRKLAHTGTQVVLIDEFPVWTVLYDFHKPGGLEETGPFLVTYVVSQGSVGYDGALGVLGKDGSELPGSMPHHPCDGELPFAIDKVNAYCTGGGYGSGLVAISLQTGAQSVVVAGAEGQTLASDGAFLYWSSAEKILRAPVQGGSPQLLATTGAAWMTRLLAVGDDLYFSTCDDSQCVSRSIRKMQKAGGPAAVLVSGTSYKGPFAIDEPHVYWFDHQGNLWRSAS